MLFNLINLICSPVSYGFDPGKENTIKKDSSPDGGKSTICKELNKVTFVELRKNAAFYMEVDDNKDVVISVGPWRMLAFIDNGAGSGVDKRLRQMKVYSEIGNLILVPASGDDLFNRIKELCENDEKMEKTAEPEPKRRKRQARGSDSAPKSNNKRLSESNNKRLSESDDKRPSESTAATVASTESSFDPEELASIFKDIEEAEKVAEPESKKRKRQPRGSDSDFKPISDSAATVIPLETIDDTEKLMNFFNDIMGSSEDDEEEEEEVTTPESAVILDIEEDDD